MLVPAGVEIPEMALLPAPSSAAGSPSVAAAPVLASPTPATASADRVGILENVFIAFEAARHPSITFLQEESREY